MERVELAAEPERDAAEDCGRLAVGCTDAAAHIVDVVHHMDGQLNKLTRLEQVIASLEADQARVADSADEAKALSARARTSVEQGATQAVQSIDEFRLVTDLVMRLGNHVTNFASVMDQVRRVSLTIENIAKTTNMLALNASIEAHRAGAAGRAFSVVAAEVKKLADDTRSATDEIDRALNKLSGEAADFVTELHIGVEKSQKAQDDFHNVTNFLEQATGLFQQMDEQSDAISRNSASIHVRSNSVKAALNDFSSDIRQSAGVLTETRGKVEVMQGLSNRVFNALVRHGAAMEDQFMVEVALDWRDRMVGLAEAALDSGALTETMLFDTNYRPIPGSNPQRFTTLLTDWADANWRSQIDTVLRQDPRFYGAVCTDMNGWLPTHSSDKSRQPTGDIDHDTRYCRNGRMIMEPEDKQAKLSNAPFLVAVYRHDLDSKRFTVLRNVYVPMVIRGRRWGDFELAYSLDEVAR